MIVDELDPPQMRQKNSFKNEPLEATTQMFKEKFNQREIFHPPNRGDVEMTIESVYDDPHPVPLQDLPI